MSSETNGMYKTAVIDASLIYVIYICSVACSSEVILLCKVGNATSLAVVRDHLHSCASWRRLLHWRTIETLYLNMIVDAQHDEVRLHDQGVCG